MQVIATRVFMCSSTEGPYDKYTDFPIRVFPSLYSTYTAT